MSNADHHSKKLIRDVFNKLLSLKFIGFAIICVAVIVFVVHPDSRGELLSTLLPFALASLIGK